MNRLCSGCGDMVAGDCPSCDPRPPTPRRRMRHLVYGTARWARLRLRCFHRDDWTCVDCGHRDEHETGVGLVADHVVPFDASDDPRAWDIDNLATRCLACSGRKDGGRRYASAR